MEQRIESVVTWREEQEAALLRSDGARIYGDEEHEERMEAIRQEFAGRMDRVEADIGKKIADAEEQVLRVEHADPADVLSTSELERANAKRNFVSDECFTLPLPKLAQRLRAVLAQGDRASMFAYAHHAALRVGGRPNAAAQHSASKYGDEFARLTETASEESGAAEVREVVAELEAKLSPNRQRDLRRAREALEEAQEIKKHAGYRRLGAKNAVDLHRQRKYSRGGGTRFTATEPSG